ncbi:MAG: gluconokinase [Bacteroidota bacterium]
MIYYVMGVSGSGKSTLGQRLSAALQIPFFDGDDFHPEANVAKMSAGIPLNDADRQPWLERLASLAQAHELQAGAVIASSALKVSYRKILASRLTQAPHWIFLTGDSQLILDRMQARNHFMPPELLQSQLATLEAPTDAIAVDIALHTDAQLAQVLNTVKSTMSGE